VHGAASEVDIAIAANGDGRSVGEATVTAAALAIGAAIIKAVGVRARWLPIAADAMRA
jgi:CO/xanthine dehydrogenase Mo-binding subunit